jgi:hypothetical protein
MAEVAVAETEMAAALMAAYDALVEKVKARRPIGSDKKPTELGFVYSQLIQGLLVDPRDYAAPWSPMGGSSMQDAIEKGAAPAKAAPPAAADGSAPAAADGTAAMPAADPKYLRSMDAAFKTAMLVDRLLMVTKDGTYREYPGAGRKLSTAYYGLINGMQPLPPPPMAPDVAKRLEEARKVLYVPDDDGDYVLKSKLYKVYEKNARAYAEAVADYADAQALASSNPAMAQSWPVKSKALRRAVDEAWDTLKTEGAEKVEAALDTIKSVGISVDARLIGKARQVFDIWNLGLAGAVPADVPYAYCSPTSWPDYTADDSGWITIEIDSSKYKSRMGKTYNSFSSFTANRSSSSTSVSGGASYFGIGARGGYHRADSHADQSSSSGHTATTSFHNDAKDVKISFQFGIVDIMRPWLLGDLFYLRNWYMLGQKKNFVSDGTIDGQADSDRALLPMIPMQMLVVRNLTISAKSWGSDHKTMDTLFGESKGAWDSSSSGYSASAGFNVGLFSATANVGHEQAKSGATVSGRVNANKWSDYEAHFEKGTLSIKGAQIVAFLCTIVPPCPPLDDPGIATAAAPAPATQPAAAPAAAPEPVGAR